MMRKAQAVLNEYSKQVGGGATPYLFTRQEDSAKLAHNADVTDYYEQVVCYMLPHTMGRKVWLEAVGTPAPWKWRNICPYSTPGCRGACLVHSGRLGKDQAKRAMLARTALYNVHPKLFWEQVRHEIAVHQKRVEKKGKRLVVRLDGTSQINIWETAPEIVEHFEGVIFQDYVKGPYKTEWVAPNRYQVASGTERDTEVTIKKRGNVVFPVDVKKDDPLPKRFLGRRTIDGDKHDLRFFDGQGDYAVLVRAKGTKRDTHGFIRAIH